MKLLWTASLALPLAAGLQCYEPAEEREEAVETTSAAVVDVAPDAKPDDLPAVLTAAGSRNAGIEDNATFRTAVQQLRAGNHAEAMRGFDQLAKQVPGLADWATYFAAWSAASAGNIKETDERVQQLDKEFQRDYAWKARAYAYEKTKDFARATAIADSAFKRINGQRRYEAGLEVARLTRNRTLLNNILDSASVPVRGRAATMLQTFKPLTAGEWTRIARAQRAAGESNAALESYKRAGTMGAKLERAQLQFALRRYAHAAAQADPVINGNNARAAEAQYLRGRALLRTDKVAAAKNSLRGVLSKSNASPIIRSGAAYMLGDLEQDAGNWNAARNYFRIAINAYPGSEPAATSFMRVGLRLLVDGNREEAITVFDQYRGAHAKTNYAPQANYWAARARMTGTTQDSVTRALLRHVVALDPYSYYGLHAADYLKISPPQLAKGPESSAAIEQQARGAVRRLDLLRAVDLNEAASYERERTRGWLSEQPGAMHALAEELQRNGSVSEGINIGWRLKEQDGKWNERTLKLIYPLPFQDVIVKNARLQKQDPYLMSALIRQESMFNPTIRSPAGAIGLMQVMPRTGASVARRIGIRGFTPSKLTDPEINVRIGAEHFGNLVGEYNGVLEHVIASYNAGMTPVARWRSVPHLGDIEIFTERIPYEETREYVKILKRNRRMYEMLYGPRSTNAD